jgi:hypothetical protein
MIYNFRYANSVVDRQDAIDYLQTNKFKKVIDIGFSANTWSANYVTHYADVIKNETDKHAFVGNICEFDIWKEITDYVDQNGKFDFAICTHTLEDITSPGMVCKLLPRIAKEGYIAVPSKYAELSKTQGDHGPFNGWIHHRWIFDKDGNDFVGYPKIVMTEYKDFSSLQHKSSEFKDLRFFWKDDFEFKIINNDYLGPSAAAVWNMYDNLNE